MYFPLKKCRFSFLLSVYIFFGWTYESGVMFCSVVLLYALDLAYSSADDEGIVLPKSVMF